MKSPRPSQRHRALCAVHRRPARALAFATLLGLAASPAALRAADLNYNNTTGNFSTGFTPPVTGATTADALIFGGAAYTATDDVSSPSVNGVRFNNTGAVIVARGAGDNSVILGGTNPFIDFNNSGPVTYGLDTNFTTNGYLVKSSAPAAATSNPIVTGAFNLGAGTTTTVIVADTGGDNGAELALTGVISGAGGLSFQNYAPVPAASGNSGIAALAGGAQDYGTTLLTNANTYTGGTTIGSARVVITNASAFGTGAVNVLGTNTPAGTQVASTGGTLAFGNPTYTAAAANGVITGGITVANNLNLSGAISGNYGHGLENNTGNNTLSGVVTFTGSPIIQVNNGTTLTMSNSVTETPGLGASLTKQGNGTLVMTNATYTGATTIALGTVQFNGTSPATSTINVGTTAATSATALNVGAGTAFPTIASALPRINGASTGALDLLADSAEDLDFNTIGALSVGSAAPAGVNYTGKITGNASSGPLVGLVAVVNLGGGTSGGLLVVPGANQITDFVPPANPPPGYPNTPYPTLLNIGPIGANGIVSLTNTNNYTGGTTIAGGTLRFVQGALGTGTVYFGSQSVTDGSANATNRGAGTLQYAPGNTEDITSTMVSGSPRQVYKTTTASIDTNGNNVTFANGFNFNGATNAPGAFTKLGAGTLTLQGNNGSGTVPLGTGATIATQLFVRQGNLAVSGPAATFATSSYTSIGLNAGDNGALTVSNGGKVTVAGDFNVSDNNGSTGSLFMSDAGTTLSVNTLYVGKSGAGTAVTSGAVRQTGGAVQPNAATGEWRVGGNASTTDGSQNGIGSYDLLGGTLSSGGSAFQIGASGTGQLTVSGAGAAFTTGGFPSIARFGTGSYGVVNVTNGGSFTQTGAGNFMLVGEQGTGIVNVSGGGVVNAQNGAQLRLGQTTGAVGIVNLGTGGTINAKAVNPISSAVTSLFNFHGGTLVAANTPANAFLTGLTAAYIYSEGGAIDTGASNVTVAQPLLAPTLSGGIQTITVANGGAGYVANPIIKITGAGVGGSAVPTLTNGVLTAITITNPGGGYISPTVTILGGNPATAATLGTVTLNTAAPASGAFTKLGTGTLTLTGTNTYTGGTLINAGTLAVTGVGTLGTGNISIGTNSTNATLTLTNTNAVSAAIADSATVTINTNGNGFSKLALGNSNTETVNQLSLGGVFQPPGTYGSSTSAAAPGFQNDSYFTGNGTITVLTIPEPGTWALLGLGVVALGVAGYRGRRREQTVA